MRRVQPLRRRLAIRFALVALAPLVAVGALVWLYLLPDLRTEVAVRHHVLARAIAGQVATHLIDAELELHSIAEHINTLGSRPAAFWFEMLDAHAGTGEMFEAIYVADQNDALFTVGLPKSRRAKRTDLLGLDLSRRPFLNDVRKEGHLIWSETFLSTVSSRLAVALAMPASGQVIIGEITVDRLSEFVSRMPVESGMLVTIIDRNRRIIADSQHGYGGRRISAKIPPVVPDEPGGRVEASKFEMEGRTFIGTSVSVERVGWQVLVAQPYGEAIGPITSTLRIVGAGLAASLLLSLIAGWLAARDFSRRFGRYTEQARAIADGRYDLPWPASEIEEFADLAENLQRMSQAIRERELELSAGEEKHRLLFEKMAVGVAYIDADGRIASANPAAESILGYSCEELNAASKPRSLWQAVHSDGSPAPFRTGPVNTALTEGREVRDVTLGLQHPKAKEPTWINVNVVPLFKPGSDRAFQAYATFENISERKKAEDALRLSEENLRITLDSIGDAVIATDMDGAVTRMNPVAERLTGWTVSEAVGKPLPNVFRIVDADTRERAENPVDRVLATGKIVGLANHTALISRDGVEYQIADSGAPIRRADGEITGVVLVFRDVTDAYRQAQKIREQEQVLKSIATNLPGVLFRFVAGPGGEQGLTYVSEKAPDILGIDVPMEDFFPEVIRAIHDEDKDRFLAAVEESLEKKAPFHYEGRLVKPSGDVIWMYCVDLPHEEGDRVVYDGLMLDVTDRKRAELELTRLQNYLANVIDSMPSVLVGVDAAGRVTQWNRHAQTTTGLDAREVVGRPLRSVHPLLSDKLSKVMEKIRRGIIHTEQKVPRQDNGEVRYEDFIIYPLVTNGVEGAVIRVDDVTERVRLEEMMIQSEKMLSVGGLAAGMAHEINNPLAGLIQNAIVIENRLLGDLEANHRAAETAGTGMESIRAYMEARGLIGMLGNIRDSGARAAAIVRNMLEFARKSDRVVSSHDLGQVMDQTLELAASDYDLKKNYDFRKIRIVREYSTELQEVPCEKSKIQQVLLNILKNGAEAMTTHGTFDGRPPQFILRTMPDGDMARIEIEDNGPGMDEATRKRVFEPFFTTKPVNRGTGLGLSVSYFIIAEDHRGALSVSSSEGKGTVFVIRLPISERKRS